jgi:hypothetical protein
MYIERVSDIGYKYTREQRKQLNKARRREMAFKEKQGTRIIFSKHEIAAAKKEMKSEITMLLDHEKAKLKIIRTYKRHKF